MTDLADLGFAATPEEAQDRFREYRSKDPFPEIPAALLNSADIYDYARVTGMFFPFDPNEEILERKLKSASYEVDFAGDVHHCDRDGAYRVDRITSGVEFTLRMNSIAFVYLETRFRLPDYIALRFNLKITHVHAGLLLGTGPLVDPGFDGRLLIPLHNLTAEDYTLRGGEGLIWVEFTKLSPNPHWRNDFLPPQRRSGVYMPFPARKDRLTPHDFFLKARKSAAPGSSIPKEIREATTRAGDAVKAAESAAASAMTAKCEAETTKTWITWGGIVSIIALVVSLSFGLYQVASLVQDAVQYVKDAKDQIEKVTENAKKQQKEIDEALDRVSSKLKALDNLSKNSQEKSEN